jgi:hypothetical protein
MIVSLIKNFQRKVFHRIFFLDLCVSVIARIYPELLHFSVYCLQRKIRSLNRPSMNFPTYWTLLIYFWNMTSKYNFISNTINREYGGTNILTIVIIYLYKIIFVLMIFEYRHVSKSTNMIFLYFVYVILNRISKWK